MRLVIDVDKRHKKLFVEAAKAVQAKIKVDEQYLTQGEEDTALLKLMEEGEKQGRATKEQQADFEQWLFV